MNLVLRLYLATGLAVILGVYVIALSIWFDATLNGVFNGQYAVAIDTNSAGQSEAELAVLFVFLPVVAWVFTRGLRRILRDEKVA